MRSNRIYSPLPPDKIKELYDSLPMMPEEAGRLTLSLTDIKILLLLHKAGTISLSKIAMAIGVTRQTTLDHIHRLMTYKLVERISLPIKLVSSTGTKHTRPMSCYQLTEKGKAEIDNWLKNAY